MNAGKGSTWKNWIWKGCQRCGDKDPSHFNKKTRSRSGLQPLCRSCHAVVKDRVAAARYKRAQSLKKYTMTVEAYDQRLAEQGGVCAMCHKPPTERRLAVDHDHSCCPGKGSCGKCIRGLIHFKCNALLGNAEDSVSLLEDAVRYLANTATTQHV